MVKDNRASLDRRELENKEKKIFQESPYSGLVASNLIDENDPHHIYVKYSEGKNKEPSTFQIPVSECEGKTVKFNGNKLMIGDDVVASWYDDNEDSTVGLKLTLNGKEIQQGDTISEKGELTLTITDDSDEKKAHSNIRINIINRTPEVNIIKSEVDVTRGKKVEVKNNSLLIGGDKVVEWFDNHTQNCTITLSLDGKYINSGDILKSEGILTVRVVNKDGYESMVNIYLHTSHGDNGYYNIISLKTNKKINRVTDEGFDLFQDNTL